MDNIVKWDTLTDKDKIKLILQHIYGYYFVESEQYVDEHLGKLPSDFHWPIAMKSKHPGKCYNCGYKFGIGTEINFDTKKRVASHVECPKPVYDGIFDIWVKRVEQADREAEERMNIPPSPHLPQPDEDMEN